MIWIRKTIVLVLVAVLGGVASLLGVYFALITSMPDLEWWHDALPGARRGHVAKLKDFDAYLAREERLFRLLEAATGERGSPDVADDRPGSVAFGRYLVDSPSNPATHDFNWNKTFVFDTPEPRGGVLLIHGLSDSPYSVRAVAELYRDHGYAVIGLRLPGHGTVPGELRTVDFEDWQHAVRLASPALRDRIGPDLPFVMVGYSNGGALAIDYTLDALDDPEIAMPTELILLTPAVGVSRVAALATFQRQLANLIGFEKLAWTSILPEFDPYKYNSFPARAGEQIHRLTTQIEARMVARQKTGALADFPRALVFQSIVDATLPPQMVVERLLMRLPPNGSELVLFDINQMSETAEMMGSSRDEAWSEIARTETLPFDLSFVTNESLETRDIVVVRREAGSPFPAKGEGITDAELTWPGGIFSLSHVAIPFRPDDPIYGIGGDDDDPRNLRLGALEARGERGVLKVPIEQVMRLRYNPFFELVEQKIVESIENH